MNRKAARDWLVQMLYQMDIRDELNEDFFKNVLSEIDETLTEKNRDYVKGVFAIFKANQKEIDEKISSHLREWTLDRINRVDLAILRVAVTELLHMSDIPVNVTVKEAVDLSRRYGDEESASFVNGILGKISA